MDRLLTDRGLPGRVFKGADSNPNGPVILIHPGESLFSARKEIRVGDKLTFKSGFELSALPTAAQTFST